MLTAIIAAVRQLLRLTVIVLSGLPLLTTVTPASTAFAQGSPVTVFVPGTGNPWLAGMPNGSRADGNDSAPAQSPLLVPIQVTAGRVIIFTAVTGTAGHSPGVSCAPDGCTDSFCHRAGAENGIAAACWGTSDCLVGIFLDDAVPSNSPAPAGTDFRPAASREYADFSPLLKQVFFIGDGRRSNGQLQGIIVPAGATRLFLGTADGYDWNNNVGGFTATILTNCAADFNCDGSANSQDFFDFLSAFFTSAPAADFNHDTIINSQDFFDFLVAFFAGC